LHGKIMAIDNVGKKIKHTALSKGGDAHEITVGGAGSDKFYPHVNLNVWGEDDLAIEFPGIPLNFIANIDANEKLTLATPLVDVEIYMIDERRIEFSAVLKAVPPKNTFTFDLTGWENFRFAKQLDGSLNAGAVLVQMDGDDYWRWDDDYGTNYQPANMCGGYVVYHKSKRGGKYRDGLCFAITRPLLIDANNNTVWGDINIVDGAMTVTAPADWLATAAYPVIVDPDFGYTTVGSNIQTNVSGNSYAGNNPADQYTAGAGEQIDTISFYCRAVSGTIVADVGVYDVTGVTPVNKLVGSTVTATTTAGWRTTGALSTAMVNGTKYAAAFNTMANINLQHYYNNDIVSASVDAGLGLPTTWAETGTIARRYSVYATYSAAAAGSPVYRGFISNANRLGLR